VNDQNLYQHECIDPDLGREIWRLDDSTTDSAMAERLRTHVTFCAACRQERALAQALPRALQADLRPVRTRRKAIATWISSSGGLLVAASLALLILLPPQAPESGSVRRASGHSPSIIRPVSDEMVAAGQPTISWEAVTDARAYNVTLRSENGDVAWQGEVAETSLNVPLPAGGRFSVAVEPIPAYLADHSRLRTTFRTGQWHDVLGYRLMAGPAVGRILGLAGLIALASGLAATFWRRQS